MPPQPRSSRRACGCSAQRARRWHGEMPRPTTAAGGATVLLNMQKCIADFEASSYARFRTPRVHAVQVACPPQILMPAYDALFRPASLLLPRCTRVRLASPQCQLLHMLQRGWRRAIASDPDARTGATRSWCRTLCRQRQDSRPQPHQGRCPRCSCGARQRGRPHTGLPGPGSRPRPCLPEHR